MKLHLCNFITLSCTIRCAVLCCAVLCRAVPCRAVPCRAVPCRAVLCRALHCTATQGALLTPGQAMSLYHIYCVLTFCSSCRGAETYPAHSDSCLACSCYWQEPKFAHKGLSCTVLHNHDYVGTYTGAPEHRCCGQRSTAQAGQTHIQNGCQLDAAESPSALMLSLV